MKFDRGSKHGCTILGGWTETLPPPLEKIIREHRETKAKNTYWGGRPQDTVIVKFVLEVEGGTVHEYQIYDWPLGMENRHQDNGRRYREAMLA